MEDKNIILILSGGMDSTTLLYYMLDKGYTVEAISFNYGQKHKKELDCASSICSDLQVKHTIIDMSFLGEKLNSSLTDKDKKVPEGHYASENMKSTIVPHRNLMMLTIANAIGLSRNINKIAFAVHAGDHTIYPDCRPVFADCTENILKISADNHEISIFRPFIEIDKTDILRIGLNLEVPYEKTWTCYKGEELACGKCGTCVERLEAFQQCKTKDKLKYH